MTNQSQAKQLLLIFSLIILLALTSTHIGILLLLLVVTLVSLYRCGVLQSKFRRLLVIQSFILLGILPLMLVQLSQSDIVMLRIWSSWGISLQSLQLALGVLLRASTTSLVVMLMLHYIPFYALCQVLRSMAVPHLLIELMELSYRYIHLLWEQGERIYEAQTLRFGYQGYSARYQHTGQLFARSFVLAHAEGEKMYDGLLTRQFEESAIALPKDEVKPSENVTLLQATNLSYLYRNADKHSIESVNLSIKAGEKIVLLGANGAGKSTLMRILAGLISDYDGTLYWSSEQIAKTQQGLRQQRKHIALVMQNANHQLFCPSVEDEIAFGLRNSGFTGEDLRLRVDEIIDCFELEKIRTTPPHLLSEGQKKWVSIATIIALTPQIILLDEPTSCLDFYYTQRVLDLLNRYANQGCSIIVSTHDINLAYSWADRALVLTEGTLQYDGAIESLWSNDTDWRSMKITCPHGLEMQARPTQTTIVHDTDFCLGLFHNTKTMRALIYGWGNGAKRKAQTLSQAGIRTTIVAPELHQAEALDITNTARTSLLDFIVGTFEEHRDLIKEYHLIISATGHESIDEAICQEAALYGCLYANLSNPLQGNIQFAAQLDKAGFQIAVHSAHRLPEITQLLRDLISEKITSEHTIKLQELSELRKVGCKEEYKTQRDELLADIQKNWRG